MRPSPHRTDRVGFDPDGLEASWHTQAVGVGWGPDQLDQLLAQASPRRAEPSVEDLVSVVAARLVETDSSFTRHDIAQVVAANVADGVAPARLDQLIAAVLARPEIIALNPPDGRGGPCRLGAAVHNAGAGRPRSRTVGRGREPDGWPGRRVGWRAIAAAVRNATTLGPDQRTAVEQLLAQGNPVEVLVGRAGTGKTFTLATVAAAYQSAGFRVVGVAPSARAARELADGTGLETFTVPRYHRVDQQPAARPGIGRDRRRGRNVRHGRPAFDRHDRTAGGRESDPGRRPPPAARSQRRRRVPRRGRPARWRGVRADGQPASHRTMGGRRARRTALRPHRHRVGRVPRPRPGHCRR